MHVHKEDKGEVTMIYVLIGGFIYCSFVSFYLLFNYAAHKQDVKLGEYDGMER